MTLCWYDRLCLQCWPVSADWPCVDIWQTVFTMLTSVCWLTLCWYDRLCLRCWPVSANWPCVVQVAVFTVLTSVCYISINLILEDRLHDHFYATQCAVGFSGTPFIMLFFSFFVLSLSSCEEGILSLVRNFSDLTWVRIQQLQEQCCPFLPVSVCVCVCVCVCV